MANAGGWIRWDDAGYVDRLEDEVIATVFFHVVIPVWPHARSRYYTREGDGVDDTYFEIPRDRRSVVLGFARTPVWLTAAIFVAGAVGTARWELLAVGGMLAAIASVLTFKVGRLSAEEHERRALLRRTAGIGAPPELLPPVMRAAYFERLADAWLADHDQPWQQSIKKGIASESLIALAEYGLDRELAARARRNVIDAEGN